MCHLKTALEWLRPLVWDSGIWDYCVLWKLGDDPSRFIEFLGCCCNGGGKQEMGLKKRKREKNNSMQFCRDANFVHLANTESCHILASLPPYMSIYSGVHGEVVLSCQPRWLTTSKTSDSKMSIEESCGTHALIPVFSGLVELYSSKHVDKDESVIEYVKNQFNIYSELETISTSTISFDGQSIDPFLDIKSDSGLSYQPNIPAWPQPNVLPSVAQRYSDSTFDGSSTGSFPSDERPSPDSNPCSVPQDIRFNPLTAAPQKDPIISHEKHRLEKGSGKSKNLLTERNRRQRINDGILSLRALVPKITKMHKAATLSDAIDYIEELNNEIKELQGELKSLIEDNSDEKITLKLKADSGENVSKPKQENSSVTVTGRLKLKVNVQVNQLSNGNFMLRIVCQQKPSIYTRLLEALSTLGLPINDANLTTCDGQITAIFTVQSNKKEIQEEDLRDSLSRLTA